MIRIPVYKTGRAENIDEFFLSIKRLTYEKTFVPLGIPAFSGTPENKNIEFEIEISENNIDNFDIEILSNNTIICNASNQDLELKTTKGKHTFKWDGFDNHGIYDSTVFTSNKIKARIKGKLNGKEKTAESSEFAFECKEVKWVDVQIDKNTKRIDVTLRVNLKDGGARGIECTEQVVAPDPVIIKECPWDKIPKGDLITNKPPFKTRTKSFKNLEQLALEGLNYHRGRNRNHFVAKNVDIDGEKYEVFMNAINTTEMPWTM